MYELLPTGANLSEVIPVALEEQHEQMRSFERSANAGAPTVKPTGLLWNRTDHPTYGEALMRWNGSAWTVVLALNQAQVNAGGTVTFAAHQPMGGFLLTGLGAGSANGHSVRYEQVVHRSGVLAMTGNLAMGSNKITGLADGTADTDALTKLQVMNLIPYTDFVTLNGSGVGSFAGVVGARPEAVYIQVRKTGKEFVGKLIVGTAVGASSDTVLEYDTAGGTWAVRTINLTFSDSSPYVTFDGGAPLAGAEVRFAAFRFNAN